MIESISAITLATHGMEQAVRFYRTLGFDVTYPGRYTYRVAIANGGRVGNHSRVWGVAS
ncbi:MAG: hypothetical protein QF511_02500 [Rhodospirillales bacterium]|jgi:catechol-2,3-dioxygenase|nr:hypothetical protein [Rhodospirillales bacterium]MDP7214829.1 hypothetical protein [Rhodospirillales bacterium]HJP54646.1 hypothetical protein [Rhodospirillales bacterium]